MYFFVLNYGAAIGPQLRRTLQQHSLIEQSENATDVLHTLIRFNRKSSQPGAKNTRFIKFNLTMFIFTFTFVNHLVKLYG